ncbi:Lipase/vitellogenin [Trinorchestia longiramus]|nr:Lipase/vitellogenin [Trinorchestia longiramus]
MKLGRLVGPSTSRRVSRTRQLDVKYQEKQYCFGEIGCLTVTKEFYDPILRPLNVPPEDRNTINTRFIFFTRAQQNGINIHPRNLQAIATTTFDSSRPTKFIIHGWSSNSTTSWVQDMTRALLEHGDYNVILVDWSGGANLFYTFVISNALVVALEVSFLLKWLQTHTALSMLNVHIIGHSLGAHISGYVGQWTPGIGRITGLDPARPYFQGMPPSVRLDPTDAIFVDVIHTNSHPDPYAGSEVAGSGELSGHVDFFPNGGHTQPGCEILRFPSSGMFCSHSFVTLLFTASLRSSCSFLAFPCKNYQDFKRGKCFSCDGPLGCAPMGIYADTWRPMGRKQVAMYLTTTGQPDYCQYHYRLVLHLPEGRTPGAYIFGHIDVTLKDQRGQIKVFHLTQSGAVRLKLGTSPSFLLRHRVDHSSSDAALLRWRPKINPLRPCKGLCVPDLKVSYLTLTPLDNTIVLTGNSSTVFMCDPGHRSSRTLRSGNTALFQSSPSCSASHL